MDTTIWFVRHAQPDFTLHDDAARFLTGKGYADSKKVTAFFAGMPIDRIYASPFRRAVDTVRDLADARNLPVCVVEGFRERKVADEWLESDFQNFVERQWKDFSYKLPGGECLLEVQHRNVEALAKVLEENPGRMIILGTHGTAMSTLLNFYDPDFTLKDFMRIKGIMPMIVRLRFSGERLLDYKEYDLEGGETYEAYKN